MKIHRIHTHLMSKSGRVKKIVNYALAPKKATKNVIKKVLPTTMLVAESLTPMSAQVPMLNKSLIVLDWSSSEYLVRNFVPYSLKMKAMETSKTKKLTNLIPKNQFKKDTPNLRGRYKGTAEELDYFIEKLIPARDGKKDYNPFYKKGQSFIDIAGKYDVNPTVLVAIGMFESGRGTSVAAVKKKNIGGIYLKNKHATFEHVEECIEHMARTIDKNIKANRNSIEAIGLSGKYCDISVGEMWAKNVTYFINRM